MGRKKQMPKSEKPEKIKTINGRKWFLFSDIVYTYEQAKDKSRSWAITAGYNIKTKIVPYKDGYLLYTR